MKLRKTIHKQTLTDGNRTVRISVPITVSVWMIDGKEEEAIGADEWRKVERAIEKAWPGWFHVFKGSKHDKANCRACKRGHVIGKG